MHFQVHYLLERRSLALEDPVGRPPNSPNPLERFGLDDAGGLLGGAIEIMSASLMEWHSHIHSRLAY